MTKLADRPTQKVRVRLTASIVKACQCLSQHLSRDRIEDNNNMRAIIGLRLGVIELLLLTVVVLTPSSSYIVSSLSSTLTSCCKAPLVISTTYDQTQNKSRASIRYSLSMSMTSVQLVLESGFSQLHI